MKSLGITAVLSLVVSFILWLVNWSYWMYEAHFSNSSDYESKLTIRYVMQGVSAISVLTEYLAILLIAVAVIMAAKRLPKVQY